jgi:hypothetical protein
MRLINALNNVIHAIVRNIYIYFNTVSMFALKYANVKSL